MPPTPADRPVSFELREATERSIGPGGPSPGDPSRRDLSPSESASAVEEIRQAVTEAGGRIEAGHDLESTLHPGGGITSHDVGSVTATFPTGKSGWYVLKGSAATFGQWLRNRPTRTMRVRHDGWTAEVRGPQDLDRVVAELGLRVEPPTAVAPPPEPTAAKPARATAKKAAPPKAAAKKPKAKPVKAAPKPMKAARTVKKPKAKPAAAKKKAAPKKKATPAKKPKRR